MKKDEYLSLLANELNKNHIADAEEILGEYEQHFAYKLADGFSEEEIAAKLGDPAALAAQFIPDTEAKKHSGRKGLTVTGLVFADIFAGSLFVILIAWGVIMAAFALASAAAGICLIGGLCPYALLPTMPYWCGAVMAVSLIALAVLSAVGFVYFAAFVRQFMRAYGRFHRNAVAAASGKAVLPPLAVHPQISAKTNRRLRTTALISLTIFAVCFLAGYMVCAISAGALEFWHVWGWFVR